MAKLKVNESELVIIPVTTETTQFAVIGMSPLILNSMSAKAMRSLLGPEATSRKSRADRAQAFKHNPIEEYRSSVGKNVGDDKPTRINFPAPGFKGAIATAALDIPGVKKTEIGRLCWVNGVSVNIWGVPQMLMSVVRMADIGKTPDVRVRAIIPEWCAIVSVTYVRPKLSGKTVGQLLHAAGLTVGIGDFRQEKGKGSFGQFAITSPDDPEFKQIQASGGREVQDSALDEPGFFDAETQELFDWHRVNVIEKAA